MWGIVAWRLEAFGGVWRRLEAFGGVWRRLEAFGGVWRRLEAFGGVWRRLEAFGGVYGSWVDGVLLELAGGLVGLYVGGERVCGEEGAVLWPRDRRSCEPVIQSAQPSAGGHWPGGIPMTGNRGLGGT